MLRFAISSRRQLAPVGTPDAVLRAAVVTQARLLASQGVDFFLLREKDLPAATLAELARAVRAGVEASGSPMRILLPGRADVALAVGRDDAAVGGHRIGVHPVGVHPVGVHQVGVHLGAGPGQLRPPQVRTLFGAAGAAEPFVSVACHTLEEVHRARAHAASAILFAPVFGKVVDGVKVTPAAGLDLLTECCAAAGPVPVFALGGVTERNSLECRAAGAAGIAGIRLFLTPG